MEDSKDKVQENLLANGGRSCECGGLNALMLLLLASEYEYVELKPSHFRKDNHQQHFIRTYLTRSHFSQLVEVNFGVKMKVGDILLHSEHDLAYFCALSGLDFLWAPKPRSVWLCDICQ